MKVLSEIQQKLKAPKSQYNQFGKYHYRSCEDILETVKPLLNDATLIITDEVVHIGDRFYLKATATISKPPECVSVSAYAREPLAKKGMDESQITGAASSYARKYALNGLFCIDDTKDADTEKPQNVNGDHKVTPQKPTSTEQLALDAICESLREVAFGEDKIVDDKKVATVLFSLKGKYPNDVKKAPQIAKWLIAEGKMAELCKDIDIEVDEK